MRGGENSYHNDRCAAGPRETNLNWKKRGSRKDGSLEKNERDPLMCRKYTYNLLYMCTL